MSISKRKRKTPQKWYGVAKMTAMKMEICINLTLKIEYTVLKLMQKYENNQSHDYHVHNKRKR